MLRLTRNLLTIQITHHFNRRAKMTNLKTYKQEETIFSDTVHCSVPKHVKRKTIKVDWEALKDAILKIVAPGLKPITAGEIYTRVISIINFHLRTDESYQPIRKACKLLLEEDHIPIVSCSKGFYYAENSEDIVQMMHTNSERMKGLERSQAVLGVILGKMK